MDLCQASKLKRMMARIFLRQRPSVRHTTLGSTTIVGKTLSTLWLRLLMLS
jgi:hypothetical protein